MFEGPVTGNIPEVLDNGEVTDGTHVTAGQLSLALTPYAQVTDLAVNTAASGNNAAAIQSLDDRVTAELAAGHERFHRLGQQRHAGHGGRQLRPQDGGGPALPRHSGEDHAAGGGHQGGQRSPGGRRPPSLRAETPPSRGCRPKADASALTAYVLQPAVDTSSEVDSKIATAVLDAVTTAALDAALLGKADASALASLLSTVDGLDTPLEVDTKIANALLGLATKAFVAAQLASRDASITALQGAKADATLLASYATNAALSASETTLQSALDAILAELAALQLSGSGGVVNAPAWAGFTTWELVRGSNVVRNLHLGAPLSAALANGDDTLSITADCYSTAGTDAAITAALLAYYTSAQVGALLGDYRTGAAQDAETTSAITAALLGAGSRAVGRLPHGKRAGHAGAAGLQDGPGPGRVHNQPNHLGAGGVPFSRRPGHGNGLEHRSTLLSYYTIAQVDGLLAGKLGVTEAASALQIAVRFPDDGGADEVVAAIGEQILGPTDVLLSNWTVRPSSGCSVVLATHTAGVSVDGYTLTLAANPWNIVRTYNLTPAESFSSPAATGSARPPTLWCTCPRQTTSTTPCTAASWATSSLFRGGFPNGLYST